MGTPRKAAKLSATLSSDLTESASQGSLVILNAPDNLRGVPIFHNGLPEAIRWRLPVESMPMVQPVQIAAFQDLKSPLDEVVIDADEVLIVRALNPADKFTRVTATDCFAVLNPAPDTLAIQPGPCARTTKTFFFSGGKFKELNRSQPNRE
jgi:hypothetical protein